jgi:hypothetical protein
MENKVLEPVEDRGKSAKQMEREGGEREAAAGREYSDAAMYRDMNKSATRNEVKRMSAARKMKR